MGTEPPTFGNDENEPNVFAQASFAAHWRAAAKQLRRGVIRFGVEPDAVDDLLGDVAVVMLRLRIDRPNRREFVRVAEAIARKLVLRRQSRERDHEATQRRRSAEWVTAVGGDPGHDDMSERERLELQLAVRQELHEGYVGLSNAQRRALLLMLRGGPYSDAERASITRARGKLREVFRDLEGLGAAVLARLVRLRRRFQNPPPLVPVVAAVATAATFGTFASLGAVTVPQVSSIVPGHQGGATTEEAPSIPVSLSGAPSGEPIRTVAVALKREGPSLPPAQVTTPGPPVVASVAARPPVGGDGIASATVQDPSSGRSVWLVAPMNCDSDLRHRVCDTVAQLPPPPAS